MEFCSDERCILCISRKNHGIPVTKAKCGHDANFALNGILQDLCFVCSEAKGEKAKERVVVPNPHEVVSPFEQRIRDLEDEVKFLRSDLTNTQSRLSRLEDR